METNIRKAAELIRSAKHTTLFTGAGISVESGIPPFRGKGGLWNEYDPTVLDIDYFYRNPAKAWVVIKEIFYDFFGKAKPNAAHLLFARLEQEGRIQAVITQNIDNLHQEAGSKAVYEFHGTAHRMVCTGCNFSSLSEKIDLRILPPLCPKCSKVLKPDFVFFGEGIPANAYEKAITESELADLFIIVGTTGEVMPASSIPHMAKQNGATIIEINPEKSLYTSKITDLHLQGKAAEIANRLSAELYD